MLSISKRIEIERKWFAELRSSTATEAAAAAAATTEAAISARQQAAGVLTPSRDATHIRRRRLNVAYRRRCRSKVSLSLMDDARHPLMTKPYLLTRAWCCRIHSNVRRSSTILFAEYTVSVWYLCNVYHFVWVILTGCKVAWVYFAASKKHLKLGHQRKSLHGNQRMAKVQIGEEILLKASSTWVGRTNVIAWLHVKLK